MAIIVLCGLPSQLVAQERKVQNRPYIDMRRWHYGFLFGTHLQDLEFVNNGHIHTLEDGTQESWFAEVPGYTPGFSVGVLGELRLNEFLSLRIIPTMYFGDKTVVFRDWISGSRESQAVKSTYLSVPVDVKWSAQRFNNYRPYVVGGLSVNYDLTSKKHTLLRTKPMALCLEAGFGCDFYLPFFKLIPELKFCFGLGNILDDKRDDLLDSKDQIYTKSVNDATMNMVVLTLYFE
jgi:hypothetical protein